MRLWRMTVASIHILTSPIGSESGGPAPRGQGVFAQWPPLWSLLAQGLTPIDAPCGGYSFSTKDGHRNARDSKCRTALHPLWLSSRDRDVGT